MQTESKAPRMLVLKRPHLFSIPYVSSGGSSAQYGLAGQGAGCGRVSRDQRPLSWTGPVTGSRTESQW